MSSILLDYHPRKPVADPEASLPLRRRKPWRARSRWPIILGCLLVAVTAFLPWVRSGGIHSGLGEDAPGPLTALFAIITLAIAGLPAVANSTTRTVQLSPAILGVVSLFQGAHGLQNMGPHMDNLGATVEPALGVFMLGVTLVAFGGVVVSMLIIRDNQVVAETLPWRSFAWALWVMLSGAAGIALSIAVALAIFGTDAAAVIGTWAWVGLTAPIFGTLVYELKIFLPRRH